MAQHSAPHQKVDLGPGFWQVAIGLTVFNLVSAYYIITYDVSGFLPEAAAPAGDIDALFKFMAVFGNAIFFYVTGFIVYFAIVWRRRASDAPDAIGIQVHDSPKLEFWWTAIPAVLVVILAVFSVKIWANLQAQAGDVLTMESIGHQFKYEFRYPKLKASVYDEMHVPVGTPVSLHVTSADVIHSFWVPEVRVKYDMVPGLVQTLRFTPNKVGTYRVICTEFCGTNHGNMLAKMVIDTPGDFDKWLTKQAQLQTQGSGPVALTGGNAASGATIFTAKCASCHNANAGFEGKIVGPGLGKLASDSAHPMLVTGEKPDAAGISHILINGYQGADKSQGKDGPSLGVMPNKAANGLSNTDVSNLTAYLLSLSAKKS
ncbi:MAG: hypothetical protein PVSMB8_04480 [Vulcanimicrobiaceae bacterium]